MKKTLLFSLLLLAATAFAQQTVKLTDAEQAKVSGQIKDMTIINLQIQNLQLQYNQLQAQLKGSQDTIQKTVEQLKTDKKLDPASTFSYDTFSFTVPEKKKEEAKKAEPKK